MPSEAVGVARVPGPAAVSPAARGMVLARTEWKSKSQQVREKNVRTRKLAALYGLQDRVRMLTTRIEILEDELDLLGWKPRRQHDTYKIPYRQELVNELCALSDNERAQRIRDLAAQEGIDRKSVYRKLQKCVRWTLRGRENPAWASRSNVVLNKRAALSDVG